MDYKFGNAYDVGYLTGRGMLPLLPARDIRLDDDEWMEQYYLGRADGEGDLDSALEEVALFGEELFSDPTPNQ